MESITALFVDDENDFIVSLIKRMQQRNIIPYGAASGTEALAILKAKHTQVDVVVLDVKMPGMDGLSVLSEIKAAYPTIEVLMLSGHANLSAALEGLEKGAFDYLVKPVDMDELLYKLQDAYQKKCLQESTSHRHQDLLQSGDN